MDSLPMEVVYEKIIPDNDQSFRAFYFDSALKIKNAHWTYHSHPELEIIITIQGTGKRLIGDNLSNYGPKDIILIGSNLPHYVTYGAPILGVSQPQGMIVQFKRDFIGDEFLSLPESDALNQLFDRASRGLAFNEETVHEILPIAYELRDSKGLARLIALMKILNKLSHADSQALASANYTMPNTTQVQQKRIEKAVQYTLENFDTPLSIEVISKHCNLSPSTFSRLFSKSVGKNYKAFLIGVRIGHACKLLTQTDLTILEIALASGFTNLSNFNRRFLENVNLTPKDYRKQTQHSLTD